MADAEFRIFLSAVSSEFRAARNALTDDFGARDVLVRVQEQFVPGRRLHTLLQALDEYIRGCTTVICVIGTRSGACPTLEEVAPFAHIQLATGASQASYTQWEYFLARQHSKECLVFIARNDYEPDEKTPHGADFPDLQRDFIERIKHAGLHYETFATTDELCRKVLRHEWPSRNATPLVAAHKPIVLPYPSLGTLFKGRDAFLRRLHDSLARPNGAAAIAGRAVHGMGGVGKTRAAVEYAWTHRADYTALFLIDAETPEKLHTGLAALSVPLHLPAQAEPDEAARMEAVLAWLNANPGWFLILDNIDAEPALAAAHRLLGRLTGGRAVLTSRLGYFPRGVERLDMDVLDPDAAAAFLLEATANGRRQTAHDAEEARALAEDLGGLALALEMAAATIEARGLSIAAYRTLWQGNRKRVVGWARQEITGYHHAVTETWRTSVDQLTDPGRCLLERLAFLAPDAVPEFLLDVPVPGADVEDTHAALDNLATYSLATRDPEGNTFRDPEGNTFLVHRLVQDVTRRGLEEARKATQLLTEALGWVNAAFEGHPQDVRTWGRLDPLAPHAEAVAGHADAAGIVAATGLMGQLALLLRAKALHGRAEPLMRRALAIDEASLGRDHPTVAIHLNNLALLLQATNRLGEAEPLMRRHLAIFLAFQRDTGHAHPHRDAAIRNYSGLLGAMGQSKVEIAAAIAALRRQVGLGKA